MRDTDPFYPNEFVMEAMQRARVSMLSKQLGWKFGRVPVWAQQRLDEASAAKLKRWSVKILTADSIEGVLGKR